MVESITEKAELKYKVLAEVSAVVGASTLLVSNTSAIPIDEMADSVTGPERFVGVHFMNPPYLIKTVELIRGPRSSRRRDRRGDRSCSRHWTSSRCWSTTGRGS